MKFNREGDVFELAVPIVLALDHGAAVDLAGLELDRDDVARRLVQQLHRDPEAAAHPLTGWSGSHAAGGSPYPVVGGREQESESWRPRGRRRRGEGLLWYGLGISLLPPTRLQLRYALVVLGWDHWPWAGPILSFLEFQAHPTPTLLFCACFWDTGCMTDAITITVCISFVAARILLDHPVPAACIARRRRIWSASSA